MTTEGQTPMAEVATTRYVKVKSETLGPLQVRPGDTFELNFTQADPGPHDIPVAYFRVTATVEFFVKELD